MLSKGKGFGNWLRLLGRHHSRAHWTRVYDLEQGAWLDSTPAIKYILSHQGTTKPIPAEAKEAASEAPTARPNGKARPERRGEPGTQREGSEGRSDAERPRLGVRGHPASRGGLPRRLRSVAQGRPGAGGSGDATAWPSGTTGAARARSTRRAVRRLSRRRKLPNHNPTSK